ncbi:MAG: hypothetical protein ACTSSH_01040 [Candidatus Heimdallarchaeota archaeon]
MAIISRPIGFYEDKGTWVSANDPYHITNGIDLTDFTGGEGVDMLSQLIITKYSGVEELDIEFNRLAGRNNIAIGIGAGAFTVSLTALVISDSTKEAEERLNDIMGFVRDHDEMGDANIYMVMGRKVGSTWYLPLWENPANGNNDRKYLQGKLRAANPIYKSYGVYEIKLQFTEANI